MKSGLTAAAATYDPMKPALPYTPTNFVQVALLAVATVSMWDLKVLS